jgi:hypothetical protein
MMFSLDLPKSGERSSAELLVKSPSFPFRPHLSPGVCNVGCAIGYSIGSWKAMFSVPDLGSCSLPVASSLQPSGNPIFVCVAFDVQVVQLPGLSFAEKQSTLHRSETFEY